MERGVHAAERLGGNCVIEARADPLHTHVLRPEGRAPVMPRSTNACLPPGEQRFQRKTLTLRNLFVVITLLMPLGDKNFSALPHSRTPALPHSRTPALPHVAGAAVPVAAEVTRLTLSLSAFRVPRIAFDWSLLTSAPTPAHASFLSVCRDALPRRFQTHPPCPNPFWRSPPSHSPCPDAFFGSPQTHRRTPNAIFRRRQTHCHTPDDLAGAKKSNRHTSDAFSGCLKTHSPTTNDFFGS